MRPAPARLLRSAHRRMSTPGSASIRRCSSDRPSIRSRRRSTGALQEHIGRAAIRCDPRDGGHRVAVLLLEEVDAQQHRQAPQGGQRHPLVVGQAGTRAVRPQSVDVDRAQPLARAPGSAHQPLRGRPRLDQDEDAVAHRRARRPSPMGGGACLAWTSSATSRNASWRKDESFSAREEVRKRGVHPILRVHLAGPDPFTQLLGREVDQHHLVGIVEHLIGERLAYPYARHFEDHVVEALQVLDVDRRDHVDSGCQHLGDVLVALDVAPAGRVGVGQLVDQRQLWHTPEHRVHVHLLEPYPGVLESAGGATARGPGQVRWCLCGRAARGSRSPHRFRSRPPAGPPAACGRSCPPRRRPRAGSGDGRGESQTTLHVPRLATACTRSSHLPAHAPSTLWMTRSISLMPMNGA